MSARGWKTIHMLVYPAYGLIVMHVVLGALQSERSPVYPAVLVLSAATVATLHLVAGSRETRRDLPTPPAAREPGGEVWIDAGPASAIPMNQACVVRPAGGERIAVFRHADGVSAIRSVCAHQGGPLGEGRIIYGCITCPWHGWQYRPADGRSPPPFTEKIPTYRVRVEAGRVWVKAEPLPPGTPVEPAQVEGVSDA
jgi:nitrite reductase/ring-hydroxylating ferredoxin subunit